MEDKTPPGPIRDFHLITPRTTLSRLNLNWDEADLREHERTKHVHRLHPYLGKCIPQLVEVFLRKFQPKRVCDPFCGSGTTLVEANILGIPSIGCDISPFNCLLTRVKTDDYDIDLLKKDVTGILKETEDLLSSKDREPFIAESEFLKRWYAPEALQQLLAYRESIKDHHYKELLKVILSRSARSARLTTHFDLDFPKEPVRRPYHCHKHKRTCRPVEEAFGFIKRYSKDTISRIKEMKELRSDADVKVMNDDSQKVRFPPFDMVLTSPPYVGLIDYHEQHRYAYELLEMDQGGKEHEIGPASQGSSASAKEGYKEHIQEAFSNLLTSLEPDGMVVIVVNDKHGLYHEIAEKAGLQEVERLRRDVNRRTGRRAKGFSEDILIWKRK